MYAQCVSVALVILHEMRMRRTVLSTVVCPALPHFRHCLNNDKIFQRKMLLNVKRVLGFSTAFVYNIFHSKKNSPRYYHKCTQVFIQSTLYSYQISMKLEFSRHTFQKQSDIKFHETLSSVNRVLPWRRTDGRMYAQRDVTQQTVSSIKLTNAPNKEMKDQTSMKSRMEPAGCIFPADDKY